MATIWYSTDYQVDIDVLRRYLLLLIKFDNLFLRLFHTFGCKQTLFKCLQIPLLLPPLGMPMVSIPIILHSLLKRYQSTWKYDCTVYKTVH